MNPDRSLPRSASVPVLFLTSLILLFSSGCSDPASTESARRSDRETVLEADPPAVDTNDESETLAEEETARSEEEEDVGDPTLVDMRPPPLPPTEEETYVAGPAGPESDATPETPETEQAGKKRKYWYGDLPETRSEQIAFRNELKKKVRQAERDMGFHREKLIKETPELSEIQSRIEDVRRREEERIDQTGELDKLAGKQERRKAAYEAMADGIAALKAEMDAANATLPDTDHLVRKGCCGLHHDIEPDPDAPEQKLLAKIGERRRLLTEISGYGRERAEVIQSLRQSDPEIRALHEEVRDLRARLEEAVQADAEHQRLTREYKRLLNKKLYVGRVILGDPRYVKNDSTPSE